MSVLMLIFQIKVKSTKLSKIVKRYDCCPEAYVSFDLSIIFQHVSKFEKGQLQCAHPPDTTQLKHCDTSAVCPCGLNVCHSLITVGSGVCTPGRTKCSQQEDCQSLGDASGSGMLGAMCNQQGYCEYGKAIMIADNIFEELLYDS